jgi:hypothetical protein
VKIIAVVIFETHTTPTKDPSGSVPVGLAQWTDAEPLFLFGLGIELVKV